MNLRMDQMRRIRAMQYLKISVYNYQNLTPFIRTRLTLSSCMKGQNLIIVMIKAFSIHKLWLLSGGGGISG